MKPGKSAGIEGTAVLETDIGIGGVAARVWEYRIAFGAERRNANDARDGLVFLGILTTDGNLLSVRMSGIRLFRPIGGGAAESNEEARVDIGVELNIESSSPSRKMAGPALSSVQGRTSKSRVEGRDSKSASSSAKGFDGMCEVTGKESSSVSKFANVFGTMEDVLEGDRGEVAALSEDVRVVMENVVAVGHFSTGDVLGLKGSGLTFDLEEVKELRLGDGPGGLRRALRSGTGGGDVIGSGFSIGVSKEKLLTESGVAGGEGGCCGTNACATRGVLPYSVCGSCMRCPPLLMSLDCLFPRTDGVRIGCAMEAAYVCPPTATAEL